MPQSDMGLTSALWRTKETDYCLVHMFALSDGGAVKRVGERFLHDALIDIMCVCVVVKLLSLRSGVQSQMISLCYSALGKLLHRSHTYHKWSYEGLGMDGLGVSWHKLFYNSYSHDTYHYIWVNEGRKHPQPLTLVCINVLATYIFTIIILQL